MRFLAFIFALLPIITIFKLYNRKELIAPENIYSFVFLFKVLICVFSLCIYDYSNSSFYINQSVNNDFIFLKYVILQVLSYYIVLMGISYKFKNGSLSFLKTQELVRMGCFPLKNNRGYFVTGFGFLIVGSLIFLLSINKLGGLYHFFSNIHLRTQMFRDLGILGWMLSLLDIGPLLILYSYKSKNISRVKVLLIGVLVLATAVLSGMGRRTNLILRAVQAIIMYHIIIKPFKFKSLLSLKFVLLAVVLLTYLTMFVNFRKNGAIDDFMYDPVSFFMASFDMFSVFSRESYVPHYIFLVDYFENHSYWYGKSFLGLFTAIIPSSVYYNKPPVDDGMYLYSLSLGRFDIEPVMPVYSLDVSSYPLETFGSMYANFGVIGLILGMFVLGNTYRLFYNNLVNSKYSFLSIVLYVTVMFMFELSVLRIFSLIVSYVILKVIIYWIDKVRILNWNI